jgi:type IV secretion system protein VirB3
MVPVILLIGLATLLGMLALFIHVMLTVGIVTVAVPIYAWIRAIARTDDQRLNQLLLKVRMRTRMQANQRYWGAVTYTPIRLEKR